MAKIEEIEKNYRIIVTVPVIIERMSPERDHITDELFDIPDVFSCELDLNYLVIKGRTRIEAASRTLKGMLEAEKFLTEYFENRKEEFIDKDFSDSYPEPRPYCD